jgi:transposase-like protein
MKKTIEAGLKAKVALEAIKGEKTLTQISSDYGVHPNLVSKWKQELLKGAAEIFSKHIGKQSNGQEEQVEKLYKSIGELKVENDWLKKKLQLLS